MATVTGLTADRMLEIEAASVVDGDVVGNNLILTKHDGSQINAGDVRGPQGVQGPIGQDISVLNALPILDIGLIGHIRAGRQLIASDFTNMGLSAPLGLWNLSDLSDSSGNGRSLLNKGAVPFSSGINGQANTAARFSGAVGQALYIADTGIADPFRIRVGSWGCWFRTAKTGTQQTVLGKYGTTAGNSGWVFQINTQNILSAVVSITGSASSTFTGISNVCDDRWHFAVATSDGPTFKLYVDGILEAIGAFDLLFPVNGPFNIGSFGVDAGTNGTLPYYGPVDEAFVTADILSEDQVRNLYCCKIPHTLSAIPTRASINIRRRRKGAALTVADFTTQPIRLHNFSAGSLGDEGSGGIGLSNNGGALSITGVDGTLGNAFNFSGAPQYLSSTDVGLPSALATRSYGCWFKSASSASQVLMLWGGASGFVNIQLGTGTIYSNDFNGSVQDSITGPVVADGQWHHVVVVSDNAPIPNDGIKRKLYLDGRLVGSSTVLYSVVGVGANGFRIGANYNATAPAIGQIDGVFICNYAMTVAEIMRLYAKGSQVLMPSPKNSGDHVEGMTSTDLFCIFDSLDSQHQVDLGVA